MVHYTHPEMFYLFIPFIMVLIWYVYQGKKLRMRLDRLGSEPVKKFLFNRVKHSSIRWTANWDETHRAHPPWH